MSYIFIIKVTSNCIYAVYVFDDEGNSVKKLLKL